jgi:hypothetical protein
MSVEILQLAASTATGAIFGSGITAAWFAKEDAEHRFQFLGELSDEMHAAFDDADELLTNMDLPKDIRIALIRLLSAHSDPEIGRIVADVLMQAPTKPSDDIPNPLAEAMDGLFATNRHLARTVNQTMMTLMIALMVIHKPEKLKVEKVRTQAAGDPEPLLTRLIQSFSNRRPPNMPKHFQHA